MGDIDDDTDILYDGVLGRPGKSSKSLERITDDTRPEELHDLASACLGNHGAMVQPYVIASAQGQYYHTVCGHKILDWTSGQVGSPGKRHLTSRLDFDSDRCARSWDIVTRKYTKQPDCSPLASTMCRLR